MMEPYWLDMHDVCAIQGEILAESGGTSGVLDMGALESTLSKPINLYNYGDDVTLYQLAASYGYGLVKNHCFVDGNKRVALIAVYTFLSVNGIELTASEVDAVKFFLDLAASSETQEDSIEKLASWLQHNSEILPSEI
ncbi:type II toxin-antitoxin system death-on-curing family toxin [Acaryochloris sp. 'Moss Beach']|uniref:type II toxin-antitoxin system death-on-curing family toxin n=1 Tax=Acaryochloris sp. 'Moss Beach' TaxID=2740837 RepID=UPI0028F40014|nr:type II toxin-antitoxin system death-on-curing family toxin [Acaryochloris sp. 'Moss Beach']UJB72134.1 type II toxin-antitoxin system death-on-curing family toxin [Acaryochloris sp. 'Moss Beach']